MVSVDETMNDSIKQEEEGGGGGGEGRHHDERKNYDTSNKIHISRIPSSLDEKSVKRILEEKLGINTVQEVALIYKRPADDDNVDDVVQGDHDPNDEKERRKHNEKDKTTQSEEQPTEEHRGFGFVTLSSSDILQRAIDLETIRGGRRATSKRQHTMYIRPYIASSTLTNKNSNTSQQPQRQQQHDEDDERQKQICYLWSKHRCPYGDECKFLHIGIGGCIANKDGNNNNKKKKQQQKCLSYKKTGKCKRGIDHCPFSHDFVPNNQKKQEQQQDIKKEEDNNNNNNHTSRPNSEKDCINWKTKGKCRKGDTCPYVHDESVREAALQKKKKKRKQRDNNNDMDDNDDANANKYSKKQKQPLWVRVFGLNYETTIQDIRQFFESCGIIMDIQFPKFDDSGRSKGYCGILFQSPKAVAKALELDGEVLLGRWLRIQSGKMLLEQWEEREQQQQHNEHEPEVVDQSFVDNEY